jgi:hypothetical protein
LTGSPVGRLVPQGLRDEPVLLRSRQRTGERANRTTGQRISVFIPVFHHSIIPLPHVGGMNWMAIKAIKFNNTTTIFYVNY